MDYVFKTQPFAHQKTCFDVSKDAEIFAILFEMGAGKSKVIVDNAAYLYSLGRINCLVVLAPNGVHKKWVNEDIPLSMPDHIEYKAAIWEAGNKKALQDCEDLFKTGDHLRILCANIEGMSYDALPKYLGRLLNATEAMVAVDESTRIKNPKSIRVKKLDKLKRMMKYRRILAGDAVVNEPFDLFSQFGFLSEDILGHSFPAFKNQYADILPPNDPKVIGIMRKTKARFAPQIIAENPDGTPRYKNLDKLKALIAPYSMRVKKEDCLDLPPKIYEKRYFKLEPKQRRMYDQLEKEFKFQMGDETVSVMHKLTLALRLQQLANGFYVDNDGTTRPLFDDYEENPRIQALRDALEDITGPVIIWCRFRAEIEMISKMLGDEAVMYYGDVDTETRQKNMTLFREGKKRFFVGTAQAGGIGLNLTISSTAIYYSNTFNAGDRFQSEDRCHRIGQDADKVLYIDLEAEDTIDSKIIAALRYKKDLADYMLDLKSFGELK